MRSRTRQNIHVCLYSLAGIKSYLSDLCHNITLSSTKSSHEIAALQVVQALNTLLKIFDLFWGTYLVKNITFHNDTNYVPKNYSMTKTFI